MPVLTTDAIRRLLAEGLFDQFLGVAESDTLEAKASNPYDLTTASDRFELAKDVSAFANADGGYLITGLTSHSLPEQSTDEIDGLDLLFEERFES
jgi:predicted HTH transcriptional regulator